MTTTAVRPRASVLTTRAVRGTLTGVAVVLLLAACAAGANDVAGTGGTDEAGFWLGLWHGCIAPITFIISLFTEDVGVYEIHNTGGWYDFGFLLGASVAFSGPAGAGGRATRRRASRR